MKTLKSLLTDRKFLIALVTIIGGLLGLSNCDNNVIAVVSGLLVAGCGSLGYVLSDKGIDRQKVLTLIEGVVIALKDFCDAQEQEELPSGESGKKIANKTEKENLQIEYIKKQNRLMCATLESIIQCLTETLEE